MSKKKTAVATTATGLEKATAASVPAYIKANDTRGTENITGNDVRFPALKLAQGTSPQVKRANAAYIDGLREGELFNSVTRENYGEEKVRFVVIHYNGRRNVEFDAKGEVVIDGNVPDSDKRCEFTEVVENGVKVRKPPVATTFKDFVILATVNGEPELMTLTFKKTQLKKATDILSRIAAGKKLPAFAFAFTAAPAPDQRGSNQFYGWNIQPDGYATEAEYNLASKAYDKLQGKSLVVDDTEAGDGAEATDKVPF